MATATTVITGKITDIFDSEIVGNNFEKRIFYVEETGTKYPSTWQLEMQQGKCNELDLYKVGQEVIVQAQVKGKKWTSREGKEIIFTTLKVNDLQLTVRDNNIPKSTTQSQTAKPEYKREPQTGDPLPEQPTTTSDDSDGDLPF